SDGEWKMQKERLRKGILQKETNEEGTECSVFSVQHSVFRRQLGIRDQPLREAAVDDLLGRDYPTRNVFLYVQCDVHYLLAAHARDSARPSFAMYSYGFGRHGNRSDRLHRSAEAATRDLPW